MTTWKNIQGNIFEERPTQWYNLRTNRFISSKPTTYSPVYGLKGIRVLGTQTDIECFWRTNNLTEKLEDIIFEPFECIEFLSEDAVHRTNMCFTCDNCPLDINTTDVSSLKLDQVNTICRFTFGGLFIKGLIDNVIDGDTFDIIFFADLNLLGRNRALTQKTLPQTPVVPVNNEKSGFFTRVSVRMYGYDAAEKDTDAGKLAKHLIQEKFKSLNGIVWCQFIDSNIADDKYGRMLAVLYEDENKEKLLNKYLLDEEKIHNIKMVFPYIGATKKSF